MIMSLQIQISIQTRSKNGVSNTEKRPPYTCTMGCMEVSLYQPV